MLELIKAGGWAMWPILLCSMLTVAIVVERFWALRRKAVMPAGLAEEVQGWAQTRKPEPAHLDALAATSPLGVILAAALRARPFGRDLIRERVEEAGRHVMHDLDRFLTTLGTIALISPLLGLLGTVSGMIRMFLAIMANGVGDAAALAGGIGESLICTEAGLVVAVPAYVFHRLLRGRVTGYGIAMERVVSTLVDSLERPPAAVTPAPAPAPAPPQARSRARA